jgi:uracil permease
MGNKMDRCGDATGSNGRGRCDYRFGISSSCGTTSRTCAVADRHRQRSCPFCSRQQCHTGFDVYFGYGIIGTVLFRGFVQVIPILFAMVAGYFLALFLGMVDTAKISETAWFALPKFQAPVYDLNAIIIIAPACIVVLTEHISHLIVTGKITNTDLIENPGLHRFLLGDGISNVLSGMVGSPPNTTYGENIGVMAITGVYSVWVIRGAALLAITFSVIGKISAAISSIPIAVMGGITMLLYGVIAVQGFRMFVEQKVDFSKSRTMVLAAITFIVGISGARITLGTVKLRVMAFAAIVGVMMSLIF